MEKDQNDTADQISAESPAEEIQTQTSKDESTQDATPDEKGQGDAVETPQSTHDVEENDNNETTEQQEQSIPTPQDESSHKPDEEPPTEEPPTAEAPSEEPPSEEPPTEEPPSEEPPSEEPSSEEPPTEEPPTEEPPTEEPPTEEPPTEEPPTKQTTKLPTVNGHDAMDDDENYTHMNTKVEIVDVNILRKALDDLRSDNKGVNRNSWVVVGHVNNSPTLVEVKSQDTSEDANLEDFRQLLEDDQVMYALIRTTIAVDVSKTVKFVYVHWIGDQVPFAQRGRYFFMHDSIESYFNPHHLVVETGNRDELSEEEIIKMLELNSMTANKIVDVPANARHERGFTQHQQKTIPATHRPNSTSPRGNKVEVSLELKESIEQVRDKSSEVTWLLAGYEDNNAKKSLVVVNKGSGSVDDLQEHLDNELVQYGLLRIMDANDDFRPVKFVYIYWIGEDVKPLMKGKIYDNSVSVENIFSPVHASLVATSPDDISDEIISKVLSGSESKLR